MEPGLNATLANLDTGRPEDNVAAIKSAVINYLREADSSISFEVTDYFNHTFSPDLVIKWSGSPADTRRVFIKTDTRASSLREDLDWLVGEGPLVLPLTEVVGPLGGNDPSGGLDGESRRKGVIVTSPDALESLHDGAAQVPVGRVLSQAVVRGGRGVLSAIDARGVSSVVVAGYRGAQRGEATSTAAAIESVERLIELPEAVNVTRLLQAVWLGSGASALDFPGATGVSISDLSAETLQFLLDLDDVDDQDFWERVASNVELGKLEQLVAAPESERFQQLVWSSLENLRGRSFIVTDDDNPFLSSEELRWFAREGYLGLQARNFRAGFTTGSAYLLDSVGQERQLDGLSIRSLLDRLGAAELSFSELRFIASSGAALTFRPANPTTASGDAFLEELTDPLENNAIVVSVTIPVDNREVICDLTSGRAQGRTGTKFYLPEVLENALPILQPLTAAQLDTLLSRRSGPSHT